MHNAPCLVVNNDPVLLNDAEILGRETPAFEALMERDATFLTGELWGQRDRRNTQDGDWNCVTMSWDAWIGGGPGNKNAPKWGFSRHPEAKRKEGSCIVLGSSVGGARKAKAMDTMFAMGLDIDSGISYADMVDKLEELGRFALIYTTFSHGKTGLELKRDEVLRKLDLSRDPTAEEVRDFLRRFDKNRYEESFIEAATIRELKHQTSEGVKIVLDTPELDKMRVIFPLAEPVKLIDLADTQSESLRLWEDKITGLARNVLGVHFDISATDPSRLFFLPRHSEGSDLWDCAIIQGDPLIFEDIPEMEKAAYTRDRVPGGSSVRHFTNAGVDLNSWYVEHAERFQIAELLETLCRDKVRGPASSVTGIVIECPFEAGHSSEGGSGTIAINALDAHGERGTIKCSHDSCQGRKNAEYLAEMLAQGWFTEEELFDPDSGFILEAGEEGQAAQCEQTHSFEEQASHFSPASSDSDIRSFLEKAHVEVDVSARNRITNTLATVTALGKRDLQRIWKGLDARGRKLSRKGSEYPDGILTSAPAPELTQYAADAVRSLNERDPFLFEYMEEPTIVRRGRIKTLDRPGRRNVLSKVAVFQRPQGEGELQHVYPPYEVVDDLFSEDLSDFCLPLRGAVDTPFFAADGTLVTDNGYHAGSQMYLDSDLELDRVSGVPTASEVQEAKRFIVDNVLADFPLGGLTRPEIMAALDGEKVPAVTHAVGLALLPFMREMIDGPTPGWILSKPAPGTGASLLVKLLTTIASGVPAPESTLPSNKEEVPKTLAAILQNGPTHIVFDNINHSVDSGDLASAQTARTYQARVLGKTQTIEVDVRSIFIFTANNVTLSAELLRRSIFIPLDAKVEAPEKRTGFLHDDVFKWVDVHRAELVHACLTLIQNWVAQGMQRSAHSLASFEDWAKVTGGVLEAAGFAGFLEGQEDSKALAADAAQDNINQLMDVLSDYPDRTLFRPGGTAKFNGEKTVNLVDILNGEERAKVEPGDDKPDPIQIKSWGYSDYDGCYKTGGRVRPGFEKLARKPRRGVSGDGEYVLHFEAIPDTKNKGVVFRMTKVPVSEGK